LQALTLLPPIVAIIIAVWKKDVILALAAALFTATCIAAQLNPWHGFLGFFDALVGVFGSESNTRILMFSAFIGALLALMRRSGGVAAFVNWISERGWAKTQRQVGMLPTLLGIVVFIESNLSILTAGFISRDLFDRLRMSRERLAYIVDSTCAPVCVIILFNAWGAYLLGLLEGYGLDSPVSVLIASIPYNFYAWIALLLVVYTVWTGRTHGPMRQAERQLKSKEVVLGQPESLSAPSHPVYMIVPLLIMIGGIVAFMAYTGDGDIFNGSGSRSVLWATGLALLVLMVMMRFGGQRHSARQLVKWGFEGVSELLVMITTVLFAFALGSAMKALGTGEFVAQLVNTHLPIWSMPAMVFTAAAVISFTTGTSWGTFGILTPIAVPIALASGLPLPLVMAAVIGGGVWGDHCSPISDTTIVSSLAAGCDHLDHVKTQLPYALLGGALSVVAFLLAGILS